MNLEQAQELALETDYAVEAVGEEINTADAAAFFLEGYEYAQRQVVNIINTTTQQGELSVDHRDYEWDKSMNELKGKKYICQNRFVMALVF